MASESDAEKALREQYAGKIAEDDKRVAAENLKWQHEIEILERRTVEHTDLDIGDGAKIAIYTRLNETRKRLYLRLVKELRELGTKKKVGIGIFNEDGTEIEKVTVVLSDEDEHRAEDIAYEIMALATINPLFTVDWFKANPEKFAMEDLLNNIFMYYNLQAIRWVEQTESIKSFRAESGRTRVR